MSSKLIVTFTMLFIIFAVISGIVEGGGGMYTTRLNGDLTDNAVVVTVDSNDGWLNADYVIIGDEKISYTGRNVAHTQFTGCTRGWSGSKAEEHADNSYVYSPEASVINYALGFNVASTGSTVGEMSLPSFLKNFFLRSVPRLITWDFNYLKVGSLQYLRLLLFGVSAGFVIPLSIAVISALGGVLQSIFHL